MNRRSERAGHLGHNPSCFGDFFVNRSYGKKPGMTSFMPHMPRLTGHSCVRSAAVADF